jgi:thioesterase domain-containing protein/acyl carrier protein
VPATARIVDALPLGPNGKLDRRALAPTLGQPLSHGVARGAPRDAIEAALAGIWKDVLRRGEIGVEDSFVALGGDSLGAVQVALAIERQLGIAIPHSVLVEEPTIARLAARLQSSGNAAATGTLVRLRSAGTRPPLVCVHELESDPFLFAALAQRLPSDQPVHALRFPAGEKVERVPRTLSALAARYLADLEAVAPGPIALVGFCFGGVVALEMARQRAAAGRPVTHVALLNVTAYDLPALVSARARARFRRRWGARLRYLRNKPDRWRWIERRLKRVAGDLAWRAVLPVALAGAAPASPASEALTHAVLRSAFRRHVARPYERDVGLALAAETLPLYADDPGEAWIGVARGRVDITLFPHDGYAMLQEPEVIRLAAWLERALEASAPTVPDGDARTRVPARAFSSSA